MKLDRLLAITMLLLNRSRVSAKELSERFEVSLRTVYRDMETLGQSGIPIISYAGVDGGYEIMDRYRLDRQYLSLEEMQSIVVALKGIQGIQGALEDKEIGGLLDKVGALLAKSEQERVEEANRQISIDFNPWRSGGEGDKEKLGIVRQAIRDSKVIEFAYTSGDGAQTVRSCEPMRVVLRGYIWYVYGYCLIRQDFRVFRLSRIRELKPSQETFARREDPRENADLTIGRDAASLRASVPMVELRLRFAPAAAARAADSFDARELTNEPDGSVLVRAMRPDQPWLIPYLLGFGTDLKVLEPASVALAIRRKAEEIVRMYE
ncbi:helix-turn-helix transcriptional regulator [Cohnella nanjingensis]|uniref:YafY family transcriptional regulator n=1 Tax=Cohnella nanjingensis TaxID=1387779 RepID=A0A7X0VE53_9BACL|nr:YafY family protein [Cohnella nanjingensis]MBB6669923.1 YafY family transcriptional regulator [Cohnella nanjingensis]